MFKNYCGTKMVPRNKKGGYNTVIQIKQILNIVIFILCTWNSKLHTF